jgi:hypothetical protein
MKAFHCGQSFEMKPRFVGNLLQFVHLAEVTEQNAVVPTILNWRYEDAQKRQAPVKGGWSHKSIFDENGEIRRALFQPRSPAVAHAKITQLDQEMLQKKLANSIGGSSPRSCINWNIVMSVQSCCSSRDRAGC